MTKHFLQFGHFFVISIHTLRMEGDFSVLLRKLRIKISIHTLRMEGDPQLVHYLLQLRFISIHTLRMEGDFCRAPFRLSLRISIHTLRMEGDFCSFSITPVPC